MTLIDTSAWVEYLRATGTSAHIAVKRRLSNGDALATTEPIVMEVLAGARDEGHLRSLRGLVLGCSLLPVAGLSDYEQAAALYRSCRRSGVKIRRLVDCLVAVVAINAATPLLHADGDFDLIAKHSILKIASP